MFHRETAQNTFCSRFLTQIQRSAIYVAFPFHVMGKDKKLRWHLPVLHKNAGIARIYLAVYTIMS
jgi:hypothetical protein